MGISRKVFGSADEASVFLAEYVIRRINEFGPTKDKPFVLGLPTGSSPEGVYRILVLAYKKGLVSFENVVTFNMDEYVGLAPSDTQSYNYYMYDKLFNHTDFQRSNIHLLNGLASDLTAECARYEEQIKKYAPVHLFLGGLGPDGHLAFNEAGSTRTSKTRPIELATSTITANSRFFGNTKKMPTKALTVGISTIIDNSQEIVLIVLGTSKQTVLSKLMNGPASDPLLPASYLQEHPKVMVVCDMLASVGRLKL